MSDFQQTEEKRGKLKEQDAELTPEQQARNKIKQAATDIITTIRDKKSLEIYCDALWQPFEVAHNILDEHARADDQIKDQSEKIRSFGDKLNQETVNFEELIEKLAPIEKKLLSHFQYLGYEPVNINNQTVNKISKVAEDVMNLVRLRSHTYKVLSENNPLLLQDLVAYQDLQGKIETVGLNIIITAQNQQQSFLQRKLLKDKKEAISASLQELSDIKDGYERQYRLMVQLLTSLPSQRTSLLVEIKNNLADLNHDKNPKIINLITEINSELKREEDEGVSISESMSRSLVESALSVIGEGDYSLQGETIFEVNQNLPGWKISLPDSNAITFSKEMVEIPNPISHLFHIQLPTIMQFCRGSRFENELKRHANLYGEDKKKLEAVYRKALNDKTLRFRLYRGEDQQVLGIAIARIDTETSDFELLHLNIDNFKSNREKAAKLLRSILPSSTSSREEDRIKNVSARVDSEDYEKMSLLYSFGFTADDSGITEGTRLLRWDPILFYLRLMKFNK